MQGTNPSNAPTLEPLTCHGPAPTPLHLVPLWAGFGLLFVELSLSFPRADLCHVGKSRLKHFPVLVRAEGKALSTLQVEASGKSVTVKPRAKVRKAETKLRLQLSTPRSRASS